MGVPFWRMRKIRDKCLTFGDAGEPKVVLRLLQCVLVRLRSSVSWPRANAEHVLPDKLARMSDIITASEAHFIYLTRL
jgi:hypothetical protein